MGSGMGLIPVLGPLIGGIFDWISTEFGNVRQRAQTDEAIKILDEGTRGVLSELERPGTYARRANMPAYKIGGQLFVPPGANEHQVVNYDTLLQGKTPGIAETFANNWNAAAARRAAVSSVMGKGQKQV